MSDKPRNDDAVARWNRAVREAHADAHPGSARAVLDASPEEVDRQLAAAGFDLREEDAKAAATYDAMVAKLTSGTHAPDDDRGSGNDVAWVASAEDAKVVSLDSRRRSRAVWLAWAVAATVTTGGGIYAAAHRTHEPPPEVPTPKPDEPTKPEPPTPIPSAAAPVAPAPAPAPAPPGKAPDNAGKGAGDKAPGGKGPH
jgi:hypothetical protein